MGRTGHHEADDEEEDRTPRKRIDLSVSQVAGAGAATLTAATAASYLNVYGTVIGAAVIAVLSTVASPLLQHWFSRSGEQARHLAERAVGATTGAAAPVAPAEAATDSDAARTAALPHVAGGADDVAATRTMALPTTEDDGGAPAEGSPAGERPARRSWKAVLVPAVIVFTLVMLVILAFELLTGRSMTAWMHGQDEPTAPSLLGGGTSAPPAQEEDAEAPEVTVDVPESTGEQTDTPADEGAEGTGGTGTDGGTGQDPVTPTPDPGETGDEDTGDDGGTTEPTPPDDGGGEPETDPDGERPVDDSTAGAPSTGT
ncbi:hypothetical protein AB0I72_16885 [Nocardiopsis sp. NPDC049922]|uniref:hypothetical protein n=1 Tax=Nocardiopsis sp. NPDC049922 TaxID=3155157 RepID=UPI0033E1ABAE